MRRSKRILALLLTVVMMVGLLAATPLATSAESNEPPVDETIEVPSGETPIDEDPSESPPGEAPPESPPGEDPPAVSGDEDPVAAPPIDDAPIDDAEDEDGDFQLTAAGDTYIKVKTPQEFAQALQDVAANGTIEIEAESITHASGISLAAVFGTNKSLRIYLKGNSLNVTNSATNGYAISVANGHTLTIIGPGNLTIEGYHGVNVNGVNSAFTQIGHETSTDPEDLPKLTITATGAEGKGVYVHGGGTAKITGNVVAQGRDGRGVHVSNGTVSVEGSVSATGTRSIGVLAQDEGKVEVTKNATSINTSVEVSGGSTVYIIGNISGQILAGDRTFPPASPRRKDATLGEPYHEHYWYEFTNRGDSGVSKPSFVYKRWVVVFKPSPDRQAIREFVMRLYTQVLGKNPANDEAGVTDLVNGMVNRSVTGANIAFSFFLSPEMENRYAAIENEHDAKAAQSFFVETLYEALLERESDAKGKEGWLKIFADLPLLGTKMPSEAWLIVQRFVMTDEYLGQCNALGVRVGDVTPQRQYGVPAFVDNLYQVFLGRRAEPSGLNSWSNALLNGTNTGTKTVESIIFEQRYREYLEKIYAKYPTEKDPVHGVSKANRQYVLDLYLGLYSRIPGSNEDVYVNRFAKIIDDAAANATPAKKQEETEKAMQSVLKTFTSSQEFATVCAKYNVLR